jgi:hypothetical protein
MRPEDIIDPLSPVPARRQIWPLMALMALPPVAIILGMWLSDSLIAHRCPQGTFFSGWTASTRTPFFAVTIAAMSVWTGVRQFLVKRARDFQPVLGMNPERFMAWNNLVLGLMVTAGLLLAVSGSYSQFCAGPRGVTYRAGLNAAPETYAWNDVRALLASCRHISGRNSSDDVGYVLVMENGRRIDLALSETKLAEIVRATGLGLQSVAYRYDASQVSPGCDPIRTRLLAAAPAARSRTASAAHLRPSISPTLDSHD